VAAVYGALAGALFGAMAVAVRAGLSRGGDAEGGAAVLAAVAAVVIVAAAAVVVGEVSPSELWPSAVAGALVPGVSQLVMVQAIRHTGASRALIVVGVAPLLSVLLALAILDEPFEPALAIGTVLIVAAGLVLAGERRPEQFRLLGSALALLCAAMFAVRDNVVRAAARTEHPPPLVAAAVSLVCAAAVVVAWLLVVRHGSARRRVRPGAIAFVVAGVSLGLAYAALVAGLDSGRVTVVAPLNATQSLWAVVLAAAFLGSSEAINRRVVLAAWLVVAGGALIGVFR
jgi:drug/metabolite transporter (DMT)-like permease